MNGIFFQPHGLLRLEGMDLSLHSRRAPQAIFQVRFKDLTLSDHRSNDQVMNNTHSVFLGYILWLFGFMGAHRFYYGKRVSGTIYFFTLGLLFVGWIIDLILIPGMDRQADLKYKEGRINYNLTWILLTFLGAFGIHRFYMGKVLSGVLYLFTLGVFGLGILYDYLSLNEQIDEINTRP